MTFKEPTSNETFGAHDALVVMQATPSVADQVSNKLQGNCTMRNQGPITISIHECKQIVLMAIIIKQVDGQKESIKLDNKAMSITFMRRWVSWPVS